MELLPQLKQTTEALQLDGISDERKEVLAQLIEYIQLKKNEGQIVKLNFICTHNSRRSQLSQIWAKTAAALYKVDIESYSGGVEVTAFNERAVACIKRAGFKVDKKESENNPIYLVTYSTDEPPITAFSKTYNDETNATESFAAVMTCSHADENCPYIPGAEARLAVRYEDPKAFDDTPEESLRYDERSLQIATEMMYVFSQIN